MREHSVDEKQNSVCIVAIFKNEGDGIEEWVRHYKDEGVDHFFCINNGSTDDWQSRVSQFSSSMTIVTDPSRHQQEELYNKYFLEACKKYTWVVVTDLDEFIYGRPRRLADELRKIDANYIRVQWKMFGSNGMIKQPQSIRAGFTKRQSVPAQNKDPSKNHYKSIVRTKYLLRLGIHDSKLIDAVKENSLDLLTSSESELETFPIHLNHYPIQSREWYEKVKMSRGSAATARNDHVRDWKYFKKYDTNEVNDDDINHHKRCARRRVLMTKERLAITILVVVIIVIVLVGFAKARSKQRNKRAF